MARRTAISVPVVGKAIDRGLLAAAVLFAGAPVVFPGTGLHSLTSALCLTVAGTILGGAGAGLGAGGFGFLVGQLLAKVPGDLTFGLMMAVPLVALLLPAVIGFAASLVWGLVARATRRVATAVHHPVEALNWVLAFALLESTRIAVHAASDADPMVTVRWLGWGLSVGAASALAVWRGEGSFFRGFAVGLAGSLANSPQFIAGGSRVGPLVEWFFFGVVSGLGGGLGGSIGRGAGVRRGGLDGAAAGRDLESSTAAGVLGYLRLRTVLGAVLGMGVLVALVATIGLGARGQPRGGDCVRIATAPGACRKFSETVSIESATLRQPRGSACVINVSVKNLSEHSLTLRLWYALSDARGNDIGVLIADGALQGKQTRVLESKESVLGVACSAIARFEFDLRKSSIR